MTRLAAVLPVLLSLLSASGCDGDDCVSDDARGNTLVACPVTWEDQPVRLSGVLTVESGAELTLRGASLALVPARERASTTLELDDGARLVACASTLSARPEEPWAIEAEGGATASLDGTRTAGPILLRMLDRSSLTVTGGEVGELDLHDDAAATVTHGAWASVAETHDHARAVFDAVTLLEGGVPPSFTARDASLMILHGMRATAGTGVYAVGGGRVIIVGGSGWTSENLHPDPTGSGGITVVP